MALSIFLLPKSIVSIFGNKVNTTAITFEKMMLGNEEGSAELIWDFSELQSGGMFLLIILYVVLLSIQGIVGFERAY